MYHSVLLATTFGFVHTIMNWVQNGVHFMSNQSTSDVSIKYTELKSEANSISSRHIIDLYMRISWRPYTLNTTPKNNRGCCIPGNIDCCKYQMNSTAIQINECNKPNKCVEFTIRQALVLVQNKQMKHMRACVPLCSKPDAPICRVVCHCSKSMHC